MPERTAGRRLTIQVSGATVPASLRRIELEVHVVGQAYRQTLPPVPNQTHTFTWDGTLYGRPVQGRLHARVRIGFVYGAVYYTIKPEAARSFGRFRGTVLATSAASPEFVVWQEHRSTVGTWDARGQGLGGWTLSAHHAYAPHGQDLHLGDGRRRSARLIGQSVTTTPIGAASAPEALAVTPDGTLYVAATQSHRIVRVDPGGLTSVVAGTGSAGCGGPALGPLHRLNRPSGLAAGPGGTIEVTVPSESGGFVTRHEPRAVLYIADTSCHRIHELRPIGGSLFVQTVAGDGTAGYEVGALGGDEIAAVIARLNSPRGLAVGPDGSLYIADSGNHRVRRIALGPNDSLAFGIITTVAGNGVAGSGGDGGLATDAQLNSPQGVAVGFDGSLFIADTGNHRVRRVAPNGTITTVAGSGVAGFSGDGGLATLARLTSPRGVEAVAEGILFVSDSGNDRLRRVSAGVIDTVAGGDAAASSGEGVPAARARLDDPGALRLTQDRSLLVVDTGSGRILRVAAALPGFSASAIAVASEDGGEVYQFDETGRHLATRHALTGGPLQTFSYDAAGRLTAVTDGDGNVTVIERDGTGTPTAIVAAFGQRTTLALDATGYLASLTNPAAETRRFTYHDGGGLLATHTDPRGGIHRYAYDALGYLVRDEDPAGGFISLARTQTLDGFRVTRTTAGGHVSAYLVERLQDGGQRWETTLPAGTRTEFRLGANRSFTITTADGTVTMGRQSPDPRYGMHAPFIDSVTTTTPGGLRSTITMSRAVTLADVLDPSSLLTSTETMSVNEHTFTFRYEAASRTATLTTPAGRQESAVLDGLGRVISLRVPDLAPRDFAYDDRGRPTSITQGSGTGTRRAEVAYDDAAGYPLRVTASGLRSLVFGRDAAGRVTTETLADGREIGYTHDAGGNVTSIAPPGRPSHAFAFTPLGLVASYTPPDVGAGPDATAYMYDLQRSLTRISRADGTSLDFEYDAAGRASAVTIPRGRLGFGYHPATGKLARITAPDGGTLDEAYDGMLRTGTTWSGAVAGSVAVTHDADFEVASRSVNGAAIVTRQHDPDGQLVRAGGLTIDRHPLNGLVTGTTLVTLTDTRGYNEFGELIAYRAASGGAPIYAVDYTRDGLGRIVARTETLDGATTSFGFVYDLEGRLQEVTQGGATVRAYVYDSNDNRQSVSGPAGILTGTYDAQDRLLAYGAATYAYTADGELQRRTAGGQTTEYRYDELGNLLRVVLPGGAQIDYVVDGRNRRIGKRLNGTPVQGFLYAGQLRPVAELDGSGAVVSRFVYGPDPNVPAYLVKGGATYRIVADHLGSPRLVVDVASGAIVQRMDYDEFGVVLRDTNPGFQPFGFAGGLYDPDTRLTRFGVRDYDAETGRWTAKDPVGFAGGINLYGYVANDPVNVTDPPGTGIDPEPSLGPSDASKEWAKDVLKEMKQAVDAKKAREAAEAAKKAQEASKGSALLRWLKGLFRGSTGCTPLIFIVPPPELLCEDIPGPGCSDVGA